MSRSPRSTLIDPPDVTGASASATGRSGRVRFTAEMLGTEFMAAYPWSLSTGGPHATDAPRSRCRRAVRRRRRRADRRGMAELWRGRWSSRVPRRPTTSRPSSGSGREMIGVTVLHEGRLHLRVPPRADGMTVADGYRRPGTWPGRGRATACGVLTRDDVVTPWSAASSSLKRVMAPRYRRAPQLTLATPSAASSSSAGACGSRRMFTGPWTSARKWRSASVSHRAIGYTQSAPASTYACARRSASETSSSWVPGPAPAKNGPANTSIRALMTSR